jgi:hypothetical protein
MLFDQRKRILKLDRLRLRGRTGARVEFHLVATAQNLKKLVKTYPTTTSFTTGLRKNVATGTQRHLQRPNTRRFFNGKGGMQTFAVVSREGP